MGSRDPFNLANKEAVTATGVVIMTSSTGNDRKKIPTRGHHLFSLTTVQGNADTATVKLKGTNNPDEADTNGEDLITNTHTASDQKDGSSTSKGYQYVFVELTAEGVGAGASFAASTGIRVHATGFA